MKNEKFDSIYSILSLHIMRLKNINSWGKTAMELIHFLCDFY